MEVVHDHRRDQRLSEAGGQRDERVVPHGDRRDLKLVLALLDVARVDPGADGGRVVRLRFGKRPRLRHWRCRRRRRLLLLGSVLVRRAGSGGRCKRRRRSTRQQRLSKGLVRLPHRRSRTCGGVRRLRRCRQGRRLWRWRRRRRRRWWWRLTDWLQRSAAVAEGGLDGCELGERSGVPLVHRCVTGGASAPAPAERGLSLGLAKGGCLRAAASRKTTWRASTRVALGGRCALGGAP
jgi:hypothetical protein